MRKTLQYKVFFNMRKQYYLIISHDMLSLLKGIRLWYIINVSLYINFIGISHYGKYIDVPSWLILSWNFEDIDSNKSYCLLLNGLVEHGISMKIYLRIHGSNEDIFHARQDHLLLRYFLLILQSYCYLMNRRHAFYLRLFGVVGFGHPVDDCTGQCHALLP